MKRLVIVGNTAFAEIAYEYFTHDSDYQVVAFSVESPFLEKKYLFGLPVYPFESLESYVPPEQTFVFVACTYTKLNKLRKRLLDSAKIKGYTPAKYISSRSFVWKNVRIGEHCFIFENNVLQPFSSIGDNTVLWSGNHLGHHSEIGSHCFLSSHIVLSGFCRIGDYTFMGVNSGTANNVTIGRNNFIGMGAMVTKSTCDDVVIKGPKSETAGIAATKLMKANSK